MLSCRKEYFETLNFRLIKHIVEKVRNLNKSAMLDDATGPKQRILAEGWRAGNLN